MKVIIDEREVDLIKECQSIMCSADGGKALVQIETSVLPLGDILLKTDDNKDVMIIERKTFKDLFASIRDGRYDEQSYRLMHASGFPLHSVVYVIEGMFSQLKSQSEKKLIYSTFASLNYFKGFSVFRTSMVRETAELIIYMADKIDRDFVKGKIPSYLLKNQIRLTATQTPETPFTTSQSTDETAAQACSTIPIDEQSETVEPSATIVGNGQVNVNLTESNYCSVVKKVKKDNITANNIGEIILCQIPGISSTTAIAIMKNYSSFNDFMRTIQENPAILDNIVIETGGKVRKINKSCVQSIKKYLLNLPGPASL
jgi:ERCC4-type nuclease